MEKQAKQARTPPPQHVHKPRKEPITPVETTQAARRKPEKKKGAMEQQRSPKERRLTEQRKEEKKAKMERAETTTRLLSSKTNNPGTFVTGKHAHHNTLKCKTNYRHAYVILEFLLFRVVAH